MLLHKCVSSSSCGSAATGPLIPDNSAVKRMALGSWLKERLSAVLPALQTREHIGAPCQLPNSNIAAMGYTCARWKIGPMRYVRWGDRGYRPRTYAQVTRLADPVVSGAARRSTHHIMVSHLLASAKRPRQAANRLRGYSARAYIIGCWAKGH
jgi:hypothetical protein